MPFNTFLERFAIGIAAASGLLTAACISGMPTASCTALAETYARAILAFGGAGLLALLLAALAIVMPSWASWDKYLSERAESNRSGSQIFAAINSCQSGFRPAVIWGLLLMTTFGFVSGSLSASYNLRAATKHCYFGTDAELAARLHDRIELSTVFDWGLFNQSPMHMPTKAGDTAK
jgi:hypothetical protein